LLVQVIAIGRHPPPLHTHMPPPAPSGGCFGDGMASARPNDVLFGGHTGRSPRGAASRFMSKQVRSVPQPPGQSMSSTVPSPHTILSSPSLPQRMLSPGFAVPHRSPESLELPHTTSSQSPPPQSLPHTILSLSSALSPQTMLSSALLPQTMLLP